MFKDSQPLSAQYAIVAIALLMVPLVAAISLYVGNGLTGAPVISLVFAATAVLAGREAHSSKPVLGLSLIGQAVAFTSAFSGHPWQIDSHMLFFAFLAALVSLRDVRTILLATIAIALHHLALTIVFPALVYPSADLVGNLERTLFHTTIVVIEAWALIASVRVINDLLSENRARFEEASALRAEAESARDAALTAGKQSEHDRRLAEGSRRDAEEALVEIKAKREEAIAADERARETQASKEQAAVLRQRELQHVVAALGSGLSAMAAKQLTTRLDQGFPPEYEVLRHDFNDMAHALENALRQVAQRAEDMLCEANRIEGGIEDISRSAGLQATRIAQTSEQMQSVAASVHKTANIGSDTATVVEGAQKSTRESNEVAALATAAMAEIDKSATQISAIIGVIEQIAFQTNLLALNAGVEAARAGDAGRGFAVVASEVRALAQRSSDAARDIGDLIGNSQTQVAAGVQFVDDTVRTLETVRQAVDNISDRMKEVSNATAHQAETIGAINGTIRAIDSESRKNAESMLEMSMGARALTDAAHGVRDLATEFSAGSSPDGSAGRHAPQGWPPAPSVQLAGAAG